MDPTPVATATPGMTPDTRLRFTRLLEQHRGILLKVARTYCAHREERDDLVQDITIQLWRAYPRYDGTRSFSTWMYRVALNVAISHVRGRSHRERHLATLDDDELGAIADDTASSPESAARIRALHGVITALDPLNRALLLLYLDEHSHREIADILGISETNVATKVSRLKQRIRTELAD